MSSGAPTERSSSERVLAGFAKVALVMRQASWRAAGERGLTPTQAQILVLLSSLRGGAGLKEVAARMALTMGTASEAVSALVGKGLVRKGRSDADGRAVVLRLTRAGARESARAGEWPAMMKEAVEALPEAERGALLRGLVGMIRGLQERGSVPTSRMCVECAYFRPNEHPGEVKRHHCLFIGAAIGDADLRLECAEMSPAPEDQRARLWSVFVNGEPLDEDGPGRRRGPTEIRRSMTA